MGVKIGGYKPGGAAAGSAGGTAASAVGDSLFWKTLELINRPSSASFGAVTALQEGDDPFDRAMKALRGEAEYSGRDVLENFGVDPESTAGKYGGFALDVLNPLDPLNYVGGLGAATKAGRAAKLVGKAAEHWDDAARAGERGLVTFAGHRVPVPFDAQILGGMERAGKAVAESSMGRGFATLFGGKRGAVAAQAGLAGIPDEAVRATFDAEEEAARIANKFQLDTEAEIRAFDALRGEDRGALLETIGRAYRGDVDYVAAANDYIRMGTPGFAERKAAWDAADTFMKKQSGFLSQLEGTGMDAYALPYSGHFPRLPQVKPGMDTPNLGEKVFEEQWNALQGPSRNAFNKLLLPGSIEPVAVQTLTDAGKAEYFRLGKKYFDEAQREDPQYIAEFLRKHRKTPGELNASGNTALSYETSPAVVFKKMRDDAMANVKGDALVKSLERVGIAKPWDDGVHLPAVDENGRNLFVKVDQGRYAAKPLAIPVDQARALQKMLDVLSPSQDKALMGAMINQAMPQLLKDAGLMQWWKAAAIFGGGPSYFSRNFFTGVVKNMYEGMGIANPQTPRFYAAAVDTIGKSLRGQWGANDYITLRNGTKLSKKRLYQEYMIRQMHGGGLPDIDIIEAGAGPSKKLRERVFRVPRKINEQVEMSVRLPLAMKTIEDTLAEAQKRGIAVPEVIDALQESAQGVIGQAGDIVDRAFKNADQQVKLSHFDYTDLAPFEEGLRRTWVPFYTWMRKNIPSETVNMLQRPGKYMPFVRAYYETFDQAGIVPEDLPEWMASNFAVPIGETQDGRRKVLDLTGFLPFMDVFETMNALVGEPRTGEGRLSTIGRYVGTRFNPFLSEGAEQALQKEFLTARDFGDLPTEMFGASLSPQSAGLINLFRPARELDRLNPGGVFTEIGNATGQFEGDVRPRRNEPGEAERWLRFGTGLKFYGADPDQANLSRNERAKKAARLRKMAMRAKREGRGGEARYLENQANEVEGA
ncbi:MAG: hypothetical protein IT366_24635 [Candidatus Hydrogenedentes bacterium]|nr:hypothetical protein [Candidatus Hydrogenedentota bacterium]